MRLKPDYADGRANLAKLLPQPDRARKPSANFRFIFEADAEAHFYLSQTLLSELRTNDAVVEFQEASRLKPGYPEARAWLESVQKK